MTSLRLPRKVEDEPEAADLGRELAKHEKPLWPGGELCAPQVEVGPALEAALKSAYSARRIVRGIDGAERALEADARGLRQVDRKTGVTRGQRVSRLLVLSDDGSQRFYRSAESLVRRYAPRVLALRLSLDQRALGQLLFGPDQVARMVLVEHKDAVSAVLLALAAQWCGDASSD